MLDHYIQREIVYRLAHENSLRFGELKPDELENKLFDYHLKKVIRAGLITKNEAAQYTLTPEGRRIGKGALSSPTRMIDRAYSLLLIALKNDRGEWLLYRRPNQPQLGLVGLPQVQPVAGENAVTTAETGLRNDTGVTASLVVHGHGYISILHGDKLESYVHFTLLTGSVSAADIEEPYFWQADPQFASQVMLPSMPELAAMVSQNAGIYRDIIIY